MRHIQYCPNQPTLFLLWQMLKQVFCRQGTAVVSATSGKFLAKGLGAEYNAVIPYRHSIA